MTDTVIVYTEEEAASITVTEETAVVIETPAAQGATGPTGPTGDPGALWYSGSGVPSSGLGIDGDWYINDLNGDAYNKIAGTWTLELNIKGTVDVIAAANMTDNSIVRGDGGLKGVQDSALTIDDTGNIIPDVDNTQELGSITKTFSDGHFTDENGTYISVRQLAKLHRDYSECAAILPFTVSYAVAAGVWTITVTATSSVGYIAFVFNNIVYKTAGDTLSVDATSFAGTDLNPKSVYVYVIESGGAAVLTASNTNPFGVVSCYVGVAEYVAGTVSTSSITVYTKIESPVEIESIVSKTHRRALSDGPIYLSGMAPSATSTNLTIGSGTYQVVYSTITTVERIVGTNGLFYIKNDGTFNSLTDFAFTEYGTGETISANKYYNVILGVCQNDTTRIYAIVQDGNLGSEYTNISEAISDGNNAIKSVPSNSILKDTFIPVARVIIQKTASNLLQQFPNGNYYVDIRTEGISAGGGAGTTSPLTTKGDLYGYDTTDNRIPIGTDGYVLTADSAQTLGLKWAASSGFTDPMTTRGDIIYKNAAGTTTRLPAGTATYVLTSDGTDISWAAPSGGTGDKISEGDSSVEVIDAGTGYVSITVDATEVARIDPSTLRVGDGLDQSYSGDIFMVSDGGACVFGGRSFSATATSAPRFEFARAQGTLASPAALNTGDRIGALNTLNFDGSGYQYTAGIFFKNDGSVSTGVAPSKIEFETGCANTASRTTRLRLTCSGVVEPGADDSQDLGSTSYRWTDIYATNGTIQTSDKRLKDNIVDSDLGLDFINKLEPKAFKWKDYSKKGIKDEEVYDEKGELVEVKKVPFTTEHKHKRKHYGMMAQDVTKAIKDCGKTTEDFAGIIYDKKTDSYGLRYTEFIAPLVKSIQELSVENNKLEDRITKLEKQMAAILKNKGGK